jgi:hypothetical protein
VSQIATLSLQALENSPAATHTLKFVAVDSAGNKTTSEYTFVK